MATISTVTLPLLLAPVAVTEPAIRPSVVVPDVAEYRDIRVQFPVSPEADSNHSVADTRDVAPIVPAGIAQFHKLTSEVLPVFEIGVAWMQSLVGPPPAATGMKLVSSLPFDPVTGITPDVPPVVPVAVAELPPPSDKPLS
jgi:hypothetical protein